MTLRDRAASQRPKNAQQHPTGSKAQDFMCARGNASGVCKGRGRTDHRELCAESDLATMSNPLIPRGAGRAGCCYMQLAASEYGQWRAELLASESG